MDNDIKQIFVVVGADGDHVYGLCANSILKLWTRHGWMEVGATFDMEDEKINNPKK
jgi:hypothetical protein